MKSRRRKHKKLDIDDRMMLQACILSKMSISQIAVKLNVSPSTISRELRRNSFVKKGMNLSCPNKRLGVCNGCCKVAYCHRLKRFYDFKFAESKRKNLASTSRSKSKLLIENIKIVDEIVKEGVELGQSLHHIYVSNPVLGKICSERTIRRLCYRGVLSIKPFRLRRYVVYKHSYKKGINDLRLKDIRVLIGRTYKDYLKAIKKYPRFNIVQFDSVIGKLQDDKALLTITFPKYAFQFGLLIKKGSPSDVVRKIKSIFFKLNEEEIKKIFPINIADNGTEFSYFASIELNEDGEKICSTYFTSPYKATDKAMCERLHELVRYFLPKGHSLDSLTQEKVNEMYSHINSYVRKSKNDRTPYDLIRRKFGVEFLNSINIKRIPNKKVRLLPII